MSKQKKNIKRLTDDELADLSWEIQKTMCRCGNVNDALKLLTSTLATFVEIQVNDRTDRGLVMDKCIEQLHKFKEQMTN